MTERIAETTYRKEVAIGYLTEKFPSFSEDWIENTLHWQITHRARRVM